MVMTAQELSVSLNMFLLFRERATILILVELIPKICKTIKEKRKVRLRQDIFFYRYHHLWQTKVAFLWLKFTFQYFRTTQRLSYISRTTTVPTWNLLDDENEVECQVPNFHQEELSHINTCSYSHVLAPMIVITIYELPSIVCTNFR